jgi:hypothetical protein
VTLTFSFRRFRVNHPLATLAGRAERPRPVIPVTLIGPVNARLLPCLLDTGSDDTLFPENLAGALGVDLTDAPTITGAGVGMVSLSVRVSEVTLRLANNHERRQWKALVGFTSSPLRQPLLGYAGFLQFFTTCFLGDRERVELTVNASYPGT